MNKKLNKHIVLIRGLAKSAEHWGDLMPYLEELMPQYQVLALDIPGNGEKFEEKSPLSVKEMVLRMRTDLLKNLSADDEHECHVVAISLGGMIASHWLNEYPQDFKTAVLINTSFSRLSNVFKRLQPRAIIQLIKIAFTPSQEAKEELTLDLVSNIKEKRENALPRWIEIARKYPIKFSNILRQLWAAMNFSPKTPRWSLPTLLLASKKDRMVSFECSEHIHEEYGFPLIVHSEAGHGLAIDDPRWLADQIYTWIQNEKDHG